MNRFTWETFDRLTLFGRRYFFRFVGGNGEKMLQSEPYNRRQDRDDAMYKIRVNARTANIKAVQS